jgi:hypothetical protein
VCEDRSAFVSESSAWSSASRRVSCEAAKVGMSVGCGMLRAARQSRRDAQIAGDG